MEQTVALWPDTTANAATLSLLPLPGSASLTGSGVQAQPTAHKVGHSLRRKMIRSHAAGKQDHVHILHLYTTVDCMDPPALASGSVDTSRGTTYQSVAVYQCDEGYTLQGQTITACLENGTWSGPTPTCAREWTTQLGLEPALGRHPTHDHCSVQVQGCHFLNQLSLPSFLSLPLLVVDCGILDDIPEGAVSTPQGTLYGATASYSCTTGYRLVGNGTRECQADGRWSGSEPLCKGTVQACKLHDCCLVHFLTASQLPYTVVDCDVVEGPGSGYVSYSAGTTYQSSASYSCDTGYTLMGGAMRQCQANGTWSGVVPICASEWQQTA